MLLMDIELISMLNLKKKLEELCFGELFHYQLDEITFHTSNNTSVVIKELFHITGILDQNNVNYKIDKSFNIMIQE